jgi:hypothetical protein
MKSKAKAKQSRTPRAAIQINNVTIRRDRQKNKWAILDEKTWQPKEWFDTGVIANVEFGVKTVDEAPKGCAPAGRSSIGVAYGRLLRTQRTNIPVSRVKHFSFNDQGFCNLAGTPLKAAQYVVLGDGGNAFYVETKPTKSNRRSAVMA